MRNFILVVTVGVLSTTALFAQSHSAVQPIKKVKLQSVFNSSVISINKANAKQLAALKGLGKKRARAIVLYRNTHGPFKSLAQLVRVKGVGNALLRRINKHNVGRFRLS